MSNTQTSETDFDVVISGYGPTGLAAASLLARRGHRVCVFERWPTKYGLPRVATIDGESARVIQAASDIDAALANSIGRDRYLLANGKGEMLVTHDWDRPDPSGFPYRISLHQPDIEDAMDAAARERGAEINQGWELVALSQTMAHAVVTARERLVNGRGRERTVRAKFVIGADGARSAVRTLLGIEREAWPYRNAWWSVDTRRRRPLPNFFGVSPDGRVAVIFCVPEGRSHSVIPLGLDHLRFNLEVDPDGSHEDKLNAEAAYRFLREVYGIGADDVEVYRQAVYPFEGKLATQWRMGRAFLAGDAAHVMTPFLGQGACSAFRDAINLSWKLDLVLRGLAPDSLLDTYQSERYPQARYYVDASDRLAAMAFTRDPEAAAARDQRYFSGQVPPASPEPALTSGVLSPMREAPAGRLGPQGRVVYRGKAGRCDDVMGWGFQLIGLDRDPSTLLSATQRGFFARIGGVAFGIGAIEADGVARDVEGRYRRYFAEHGLQAMLVRPDFTVFGGVRALNEVPSLVDQLRDALSGLH